MKYLIIILIFIIINGCGITVKHVIEQEDVIEVEPVEVIITGNPTIEFPELPTYNIEEV